ncbi:hypothetical protein [Paenibacillus sp. NPDC058174]|uniref:hypothetical protein n=1 Tax=Paenibacillus sp. NPDC058174 TaxID=3346366 RepID=UPI0036DC6E4F
MNLLKGQKIEITNRQKAIIYELTNIRKRPEWLMFLLTTSGSESWISNYIISNKQEHQSQPQEAGFFVWKKKGKDFMDANV